MWHFISEQISQSIQQDFICNDIREIHAGESHHTYRIAGDKKRFFVKTNQKIYLSNFEAEAEGLEHLRQTQLFRVPKVICSGIVSDHSFLVLEHLTMTEGEPSDWYGAGRALAEFHKNNNQQMYGWQDDNYIGLTQQCNRWAKKWNQFYAEQRIGFMLQLLYEKGFALADIDKVVEAVKSLFAGYNPQASMLHGDLWQGNLGFNHHQLVLFDPAFYFGDRETDLAMTELFGRFPESFYRGYQDVWPVDPDYEYRKPIYQLYHILNHALMFGGQYLESAKITLKNLDA
ncbi:fructosamine kinase family protein [Paraglaciecola aestuariivivens]